MDITTRTISSRNDALLVADYDSYRKQLSRRMLTLRRKLGRATPKKEKYAPKAPITSEDIGRNHEFAYLLLYAAERCWAHAMHFKSKHSQDTTTSGIPASARSHIISRLHKAASYSKDLVKILFNRSVSLASEIDLFEARAYAASMCGAEEFEKHSSTPRSGDVQAQKQMWESCIRHFSEARVIYSALYQSTKNDLFKEILAGTIDPSIRYAAYQSHLPRSLAVPVVAKQHFPRDPDIFGEVEYVDPDTFLEDAAVAAKEGKTASNVPDTVTWRGRTANISDASIGQALANLSIAEERLGEFLSAAPAEMSAKQRAAAYDDVLIASQDAVDATRRAIEELEKEGVPQSDPRTQDLAIINISVNYAVVGWRVGRNRVLIGDDDGAQLQNLVTKTPKRRKEGKKGSEQEESNGRKLARLRERVVLYDAILQSIDTIGAMRGAMRDEEFIRDLDSKRAYFRALKCINIAHSHALLSAPKNALALSARALEFTSSFSASLSETPSSSPESSGFPSLEVSPSKYAALRSLCGNLVTRYRALATLQNFETNSKIAAEKNMTNAAPLVLRLHEYPASGADLKNLVTYPPQLEPVPVKPIFLDVAWNYIDYPGRERGVVENGVKHGDGMVAEQPQAPTQEESRKERKGWFGFGR